MSLGAFMAGIGNVEEDAKNTSRMFNDLQTAHDARVAAENERIKRLRQEEYLQKQRALAQQQIADLQPAQARQMATPVAPAEPEFDDFSTGGVYTTPTQAPSAARRPLPPDVTPSTAGAGRGRVNPPLALDPNQPVRLSAAERQAQLDRLALLKAPAAAADVVQAPMAGVLNLGGAAITGVKNLGNRIVNAVTGKPTLRTDYENPMQFGMTPLYDKIRAEEDRLNNKNVVPSVTAQGKREALAARKAKAATATPATATPATATPATATPATATPATATQAAPATAPSVWDTDKRAEKYADVITRAAQANNIDPAVLRRLIGTESSYDPNAVSYAGRDAGLGIAQINAVHGLSDADRLNPEVAIPFAAQLLGQYLREANGNMEEALLRYKGASSAQGRASMAAAVKEIVGSPMVRTSAPTQAAPAQAATAQAAPAQAAPAQVALPAAGQPATPQQAAVMFSPEYVNGTQQQAGEEIRMARMQLAEINQLLAAAPDNTTASTLLAAAQKIRFGAQNSLYKDAAARAARGDENAVAQLAGAAAIQYAQTPQGYVAVAQDQNGNWVATSQPMARETFINNLYSVATGAASARAAKQADQDIKTNADMRVAQQKFGQDLMMERLKSQNALEKLVVEKRLTPVDSKITISSFDGKAYVTNRDGVFVVEPGKDIGNGIKSEPSLVPISPANMPAY